MFILTENKTLINTDQLLFIDIEYIDSCYAVIAHTSNNQYQIIAEYKSKEMAEAKINHIAYAIRDKKTLLIVKNDNDNQCPLNKHK